MTQMTGIVCRACFSSEATVLISDVAGRRVAERDVVAGVAADVNNPSFASLLDALRLVDRGTLSPWVLQRYHRILKQELDPAQASLRGRPLTEEVCLALESVRRLGAVVADLQYYLRFPTRHAYADTVRAVLDAKRFSLQAADYIATRTEAA
jgi:hypothetical protein